MKKHLFALIFFIFIKLNLYKYPFFENIFMVAETKKKYKKKKCNWIEKEGTKYYFFFEQLFEKFQKYTTIQ